MSTSLSTLSKSEFAEKYMGILQPLEGFVTFFYRQHPKMYDSEVLSVYEALLKDIKAKLTNYPASQHKLEGVSGEIYAQLNKFLVEQGSSYSIQEIRECLKTLEKSLKMWNRERGSRGYLNFINEFN